MKAAKIERFDEKNKNSILTRDHSFRVVLGNNSTNTFSNRKHLTKFLAETNEFLKTKLFELNKIYIEVFTEYRKMWFYFDSKERAIISLRFDEDITVINKKFDLIIERGGWENGNSFVFIHLNNIVKMFEKVLSDMIEVQRVKSNYVEKRNLEVIASRLGWIKQSIDGYGK